MKHLLIMISFVFTGYIVVGQTTGETIEGVVSYITFQNVYVKFISTKNIAIGDSLFIKQGDQWIPVLKISNLSSISCVCTPIGSYLFTVSDKVYSRPRNIPVPEPVRELRQVVPPPAKPPADSLKDMKPESDTPKQDISGFAAVASYVNFSNTSAGSSLKMKYTLAFNMRNIGNSNLSGESYITFSHTDRNWGEIQSNVFAGLKIYNLSLNYQFNKHLNLLFGRKINPRISNIGANDGLQFEMTFKPVSVGIIAGSRPNYTDYGINLSLVQFGGYVAQENATNNGFIQTTLAFIEQTNSGKIDRQILYLQHANSVIRNLSFFGSVEVDLYNQVLNPEDSTFRRDNTPKVSNLYLSLSYRLKRKLSLSVSYSALQNVIYYETYKSFLDELLNKEVLQGYQLQVTYRPVSRLSVGASAAYRFQKEDPKPTRNLYTYITYSQIPGIRLSSTLSFTLLETAYISGKIYSLGISKDFFAGKLSASLNYLYVDYRFSTSDLALPQHVAEANLTWRIFRNLAFSLYYEGTFEAIDQFNRIYIQINLGI